MVSQLLQHHRLGFRKACKTLPLGRHIHRDQQFKIIEAYREEFTRSGDPIISMDSKHKEFLGLLFREGRLYTQKAMKALDHDFPSSATGVIYPHGCYDIKQNIGIPHHRRSSSGRNNSLTLSVALSGGDSAVHGGTGFLSGG